MKCAIANRFHPSGVLAWVITLLVAASSFARPVPEPLAWNSLTKQQTLAAGETTAQFTFSVTNVSAAEVVVEKVTTSCGCTAAQLPAQPWHLQPGDHGDLKFTRKGSVLDNVILFKEHAEVRPDRRV